MATIKFGTDGWRARIAEDFTFANVEIAAQAVADYVKANTQNAQPAMLVGYDRRFASDAFARRTAEVFAGNAIAVDLLNEDVPTPLVSFEVKRRGLDGFIVPRQDEFQGEYVAPYAERLLSMIAESGPRIFAQKGPLFRGVEGHAD